MSRPSDSAGRSQPGRRPAGGRGSRPPLPPVGRRREREAPPEPPGPGESAGGSPLPRPRDLAGEASWSPEPAMRPAERSQSRPAIDPARAMPGLPPRASSAPPAPRVEIHPPPAAGGDESEPTCAGCGYDLRGTPAASRCPECGQPVRRRTADPGIDAPLSDAPRWLIRRVAIGCGLAAASAALALTAITIGLFRGLPAASVAWLLLLAGLGWAAGLLVLSRPSDDAMARFNGLAPRDPVRRIVRGTLPLLPLLPAIAVLGAILAALPTPPPPAPPGPPPVVGVQTPFGVYKSAAGPQTPRAAAPAPATFATRVIDRLPTARLVALPFVLVQIVVGLLMLERMAVWVRDGFAQRTLNAAQWLLPIAALMLLVSGMSWTDGWGVRLDRLGARAAPLLLLPLVLGGWLVAALISLAAASIGSIAHAPAAVDDADD